MEWEGDDDVEGQAGLDKTYICHNLLSKYGAQQQKRRVAKEHEFALLLILDVHPNITPLTIPIPDLFNSHQLPNEYTSSDSYPVP